MRRKIVSTSKREWHMGAQRHGAGRVVILALLSRILVLGMMFLSDALFVDLDTSSHLIMGLPCLDQGKHQSNATNGIDFQNRKEEIQNDENRIESYKGQGSMVVWDTVFFVRIAKCGYEHDLNNAFFPLLPIIMRFIGRMISACWIQCKLDGIEYPCPEQLYTSIALVVNIIAFCGAALLLYLMTLRNFEDPKIAAFSVLFFCFNPASVFYSAAYTESLFTAFTWMGILFHKDHFWWSVASFTLASASRSNGILSCWFLIYNVISKASLENGHRGLVWNVYRTWLGCACVITPYLWLQLQAYQAYCKPSFHEAGQMPEFCEKSLPSVYGYVQKKYWDVGFLRFYQKIDRWPWVVQSIPILSIACVACWTWVAWDWRRAFTFGFQSSRHRQLSCGKGKLRKLQQQGTLGYFQKSASLAPYVYHLGFMTFVSLFFMHVNVATRFLSSSPLIYWFVGIILSERSFKPQYTPKMIWIWTWGFIVLGCLMFPNFYPWT